MQNTAMSLAWFLVSLVGRAEGLDGVQVILSITDGNRYVSGVDLIGRPFIGNSGVRLVAIPPLVMPLPAWQRVALWLVY